MKRFFLKTTLFFLLFIGDKADVKIFAQNKNIDSLISILKTAKPDTNKVNRLYDLCWEYRSVGLYDTALYYGNCALQLAQQLNYKKGITNSYNGIGVIYMAQGNYPKTLDYYLKALRMDEEMNDKNGRAKRLCNIGIVYGDQGDYPKALNYDFMALSVAKELGNKKYMSAIFDNIGNVLYWQADYNQALEYFFKALEIAKELENESGIESNLGNIGNVYRVLAEAIPYDKVGTGTYLQKENLFNKALDFSFKSLKLAEESGNKNGIAIQLENIGSVYTKTGKFKDAEKYLKKSLAIDDSIGSLDYLMQCEESLSQLYDTIARIALNSKQYSTASMNFKLSLLYYKKAILLKDSLFSQENKKQFVQKELSFEFEKKEESTKVKHEQQIAVAEAEKKKQKIIIWCVVTGLLLIIVFSFFMFSRWRITQRQKIIIEKQKEKIVDSINYAQRIQQSILMEETEIQNYLPDSFIFYQPKDIVSGDFYWFSGVVGSSELVVGSKNENDPNFLDHELRTTNYKLIIAAIDCTGHGVPGAFMSMIGNILLNQIVNEKGITTPSDILRLLNLAIHEVLHQEKDGVLSRDGMDIALCCIDYKKNELQYAGAQNSLFVVLNNEVTVVKADWQGVGGGRSITKTIDPIEIAYTNHVIPIKKGMSIYLFTDGYMDQFGLSAEARAKAEETPFAKASDVKGKKFGIQRFKELLLNNQHLSMQKQKEIFANSHFEWKGKTSQTDDILVMGIRF